MKKKIILVLLMTLLLYGCSQTYEDSNGADCYDLQTLQLNDVFEGYSSSGSSTTKEKMFANGAVITYKKFNGITDIAEFDQVTFGDSDRTLIISYHIAQGNGALVIRDMEKILEVVKINEDEQTFFINSDDSIIYLTVYGESCEFTIDYEVIY